MIYLCHYLKRTRVLFDILSQFFVILTDVFVFCDMHAHTQSHTHTQSRMHEQTNFGLIYFCFFIKRWTVSSPGPQPWICLPGVVALPLSIGDAAFTASRAGGPRGPRGPETVLRPGALVALLHTMTPATPLKKRHKEVIKSWRKEIKRWMPKLTACQATDYSVFYCIWWNQIMEELENLCHDWTLTSWLKTGFGCFKPMEKSTL